jgi:hypothetical protein
MNAFIAASEVHAVAVQNVLRRSASRLVAALPSAFAACRADRNASQPNIGKNLQARTRNRVIETKNIISGTP